MSEFFALPSGCEWHLGKLQLCYRKDPWTLSISKLQIYMQNVTDPWFQENKLDLPIFIYSIV